MVQYIHASSLCLLAVTVVQSQYIDFYSALQPYLQHTTSRSVYSVITTTRKPHRTNPSRAQSSSYLNYDINNFNRNSDGQSNADAIVFEDDTAIRRKNKNNSNKHEINSSADSTRTKVIQKDIIWNVERPKSRQETTVKPRHERPEPDRQDPGKTHIHFDTNLNDYVTKAPLNYEASRRTTKSYSTTQNPPHRPGVKPTVAHGPPITNRPGISKDEDVTPELIMGPNEDYMSTVEKKRYIEMTEKMCDKYKALYTKQINIIPLLPLPEPVKINISTCEPFNIPLVVGGLVVNIQQFPHMALLGWKKIESSSYSWKCGGSLVSNQYILTAGHCAYQDRDNDVIAGPPTIVQLGSSFLNDPNGKLVKVAAVIRHPKYKQPKSYYDIAIVKLVATVTFTDLIKPACLGPPPNVGDRILATGWGRTEYDGDQSKELRSVSIPVWSIQECLEALGTSRKLPDGPSSESQICAGERRGGKDTCQGDSGGPGQVQDGCIWRVIAITSLGRSCGAPNTPALYATVPRPFVAAVAFDDKTTQTPNRQDIINFDQHNNQRQNDNQNYYNSDNPHKTNTNHRDDSKPNQRESDNNENYNHDSSKNQNEPKTNEQQSHNQNYDTHKTNVVIRNEQKHETSNSGTDHRQSNYENYNNQNSPNYNTDSSITFKNQGDNYIPYQSNYDSNSRYTHGQDYTSDSNNHRSSYSVDRHPTTESQRYNPQNHYNTYNLNSENSGYNQGSWWK